jgi:alkylhydroperoxidase family enzyme
VPLTESRFAEKTAAVVEAVLTAPGDSDPSLRRAVYERARALTAGPAGGAGGLAERLATFVDKVATRAHAVTDADVEGLLVAGYSEDFVFEAIVSAALGAGMARLELGLVAVREAGAG